MSRPHVLLLNWADMRPLDRLRAQPGVDISVITRPQFAHLYDGLPCELVDDFRDELNEMREAALRLARRAPITHVLSTIEKGVPAAGFLRAFLGLPGMGFDQAMLFTNKYAMKLRLAAHGLPVAAFTRVDDPAAIGAAAETVGGWPVIVKPIFGSGSRGIVTLRNEPAYREKRDSGALGSAGKLEPVIVEQFLSVPREYHCDAVVRDGAVVAALVSQYTMPLLGALGDLSGSYVIDAGDPAAVAVRALNERVVTAFGLRDGVVHLEVLGTDGGYLVGEIGVRPGGAGIVRMTERILGVNLWEELVRATLGVPPTAPHAAPPGFFGWLRIHDPYSRKVRANDAAVLRAIPGIVLIEPGTEESLLAFAEVEDKAAFLAIEATVRGLIEAGSPVGAQAT